MDCLLDSKAKFLAVAWVTECIEVNIDKSEEKVFLAIVGHQNRNDFDRYHAKEKK